MYHLCLQVIMYLPIPNFWSNLPMVYPEIPKFLFAKGLRQDKPKTDFWLQFSGRISDFWHFWHTNPKGLYIVIFSRYK